MAPMTRVSVESNRAAQTAGQRFENRQYRKRVLLLAEISGKQGIVCVYSNMSRFFHPIGSQASEDSKTQPTDGIRQTIANKHKTSK